MTVKERVKGGINKVAETHMFLRFLIQLKLKEYQFPDTLKGVFLNTENFYDYWTKSYSDKFFDMGSLIRLATEIEVGLKYYYMDKMGHRNLIDLENDVAYKQNIFQRLFPWQKDNAIILLKNKIDYDLEQNAHFVQIQELMMFRHLYAHNSGLLNRDFISKYLRLTGMDIGQRLDVQKTYPAQDLYFFEPLDRLNEFVEASRLFVESLP